MLQTLPLLEFLMGSGPILDVRSPSEYIQGNIPGSISFPLFSDCERAEIGTAYKKKSRQEAVELGLLLLEPKIDSLLDQASSFLTSHSRVLCWRGGMRSGFTARLLELLGHNSQTLQGGYKSYLRWVLQRLGSVASLNCSPNLCILGGLTGSGKTAVLQALQKIGEQVIDLESLAGHRGSVFGGIGLAPQPTQEQFENNLAFLLASMDWSRPVWVEDESRLIGCCHLPHALYQSMLQSPLFLLESSPEERMENLLAQYGSATKEELLEATRRIHKRLGSQRTNLTEELFIQGKTREAFEQLLYYYDKTYQHQLSQRHTIHTFPIKEPFGPDRCAIQLKTSMNSRNTQVNSKI
jgi:tRNA 2-selenouridine synthase